MPVTFDPSGDMAYFDGTATVTVSKMTPAGVATNYTGVRGLRIDFTAAPIAAGGYQLTPRRAVWHLDADTLSISTLDRGDRITDGSEVWVIESAKLVTMATRWECECQKRVS